MKRKYNSFLTGIFKSRRFNRSIARLLVVSMVFNAVIMAFMLLPSVLATAAGDDMDGQESVVYYCGYEDHTHGPECYELVCPYDIKSDGDGEDGTEPSDPGESLTGEASEENTTEAEPETDESTEEPTTAEGDTTSETIKEEKTTEPTTEHIHNEECYILICEEHIHSADCLDTTEPTEQKSRGTPETTTEPTIETTPPEETTTADNNDNTINNIDETTTATTIATTPEIPEVPEITTTTGATEETTTTTEATTTTTEEETTTDPTNEFQGIQPLDDELELGFGILGLGDETNVVIIINGTKIVRGTPAPAKNFTFNLTQVKNAAGEELTDISVINPNPMQESVSTSSDEDTYDFFFRIEDLPVGTYYFKIWEDQTDAPDGWTYDSTTYIVKVEVTNGHAIVYYPDGTIAVDGEVIETGGEDTIAITPEVTDATQFVHGYDLNNRSSMRFNGEILTAYYYTVGDERDNLHPISFRHIYDAEEPHDVIIGAAYCIDMDEPADNTNPYDSFDNFAEFVNKYPDTYEEILWLTRNGFMSNVERTNAGVWGGTNNLSALIEDLDVLGLTADEAYCATQLAIWHFSNLFYEEESWQQKSGKYQIFYYKNPSDENCTTESQRIWAAYCALITAAADAKDKAITEITLSVSFDTENAYLVEGEWYGPITVNVDLLPEGSEFVDKNEVEVTLNGSYELASATDGTLLGAIKPGTQFYVKIGTNPPTDSILELVTATVSITQVTVQDVFILNNTSNGAWGGAQAVTGIGAIQRDVNLSAEASLYYNATQSRLTFINKYTPPEFGQLTLTKEVENNGWASSETFKFEVIFDSEDVKCIEFPQINPVKINDEDKWKWTITLTENQRFVTFTNIPLNTTYTITEATDDKYNCVAIEVNGTSQGSPATGIVTGTVQTASIQVTYRNAPIEVTIIGEKIVSGNTSPIPEETFTFNIEFTDEVRFDSEGKPVAVVDPSDKSDIRIQNETATVTHNEDGTLNPLDGKFSFGPITGLEKGRMYYFKVTEEEPVNAAPGWTYDDHEYIVVVVVDADGNVEVYYPQSGDTTGKQGTFTNKIPSVLEITYKGKDATHSTVYNFNDEFVGFCADKFLGEPTLGSDIAYKAFYTKGHTHSELAYSLYMQLTTNTEKNDRYLRLFGFEYVSPFKDKTWGALRNDCRYLTEFLIWYFEFRALYPEYDWNPWDFSSWSEILPAKQHPEDPSKVLPKREMVNGLNYRFEFERELKAYLGDNYLNVFATAVETIDRMMYDYNSNPDGKCITSLEMLYEPDSETSGKLSFSYDGYQPAEHSLSLKWTTTSGNVTVTKDSPTGTPLSSPITIENINDVYYVNYTDAVGVKFTLNDGMDYLVNGSINGKYYISDVHGTSRQRMLFGFAQFATMECELGLPSGDKVTFKNTYETTDLTLTKKVEGNPWGEDETFTFTVEFDAPNNITPIICDGTALTYNLTTNKWEWTGTLTFTKRTVKFDKIPLYTGYTIKELVGQLPDGYKCTDITVDGETKDSPGSGIVTGNADNILTIYVTYTNKKTGGPELPHTGGVGTKTFTVIGSLLMTIAAGAFLSLIYYKKLEVRVRRVKKAKPT